MGNPVSTLKRLKFSTELKADFVRTLRKRVNDYFSENNISKNFNFNMLIKSLFCFSLYFVPYFLLVFGVFDSVLMNVVAWALVGLGMASIGLCVMHDANHGSYFSSPLGNRILSLTLNILGGTAKMWKIQHNILHHSYTNIDDLDEDIQPAGVLRFSPFAERKKLHKYQHFYAWFFYGLMTLSWITAKDFMQVKRYRLKGLIKTDEESKSHLRYIIGWKIFYYSYSLVIPLIFCTTAPWVTALLFLMMHFISGFTLSLIFQLAHIFSKTKYPEPDQEGIIENNWFVHQMETTSNYATKDSVITWLVGSLNYQVEHHLFPSICHIHYPKISGIVKQTAKEFGVPYYSQPTMFSAIVDHTRTLRWLGRV